MGSSSSALKVSPKPSGYNSNNRTKMNGYGNMYGAGYGDLSAYSPYGGMSAYGQPLDPAMYGAPAAATYASASAAYAQQQQPQVQAVQQVQQGVGSFPATPQQLAAYQQQQAAHYQQQQAAGANLPPPRDFSTLSPVEQDTLLQQMGLDRSQVATNVQMQPAAAQAQTQQQYQYAVAPSQAAQQQQQPVEQQQQYLPVPEAPPHYSNRYNHSREAQGQPAQVVYQQQQQGHQLPQRQVQTPPPPQYAYERYAPPPPPLRREHRHQHRGDGRVYFPPREATIDELLDFLPPRPGVYQARPPRQRLPPLSHDLVYSKPRRVIDDDDYDGYVVESRYLKRRPSLSTRSKSHECCPPHHHRPRNARFYSDEDFYSDYSDYSDY